MDKLSRAVVKTPDSGVVSSSLGEQTTYRHCLPIGKIMLHHVKLNESFLISNASMRMYHAVAIQNKAKPRISRATSTPEEATAEAADAFRNAPRS
jgi:hypothetical protein